MIERPIIRSNGDAESIMDDFDDAWPRRGCVIEQRKVRPNGKGDLNEVDAAYYLGCSPRRLRKMRSHKEGPTWRQVAGRIWYPLQVLDEYLDQCLHETKR